MLSDIFGWATLVPALLALACGLGAWRARRRGWRAAALILAGLTPLLLAATVTGFPIVGTNAQLAGLNSYQFFAVLRLGVNTIGDAPAQWFLPSTTACSITGAPNVPAGTRGNIGTQTASHDGGCFNAAPIGHARDIREFAARLDGATDDGPAINACLAAESGCLVPKSQAGAYIATSIVNKNSGLKGVYVSTTDQNSFIYPGSSFLYCSTSVSPCLQNGTGTNSKGATALENLIVSRAGGTPAPGTIGVLWWDVYGSYVSNVMIRNSDTCARFFTDNNPGFAGSAAVLIDLRVNSCATHYWDFDGWPELMIFGGRVGKNGSGDYPAQDYVYFENSVANPSNVNTISFFGTQFNTGNSTDVPACFFRWGNFATGGATISQDYKFIGVHAEGGVGGPRTGVLCSDPSVLTIGRLNISHSEMNPNDGTTPFAALSPNTQLDNWRLSDNQFAGCHDMTFAPAPAGGMPGFRAVSITNNFGCGVTSYTSPGTGANTLVSTGNQWGGTTIAGRWDGKLIMNEANYGTTTDTASGNVFMAGPWITATPVLEMNGAAGAWALTGGSILNYQRTLDGGFTVRYSFQVATVDPATTGTATLNGLPVTCVTGVNSSSAPQVYTLSGITSLPTVRISATNFLNFNVDNGAGHSIPLTNANFNSTSDTMVGSVHCTQAQ